MLSCLAASDSLRSQGLVAHQAPLSMEARKYWRGLSFPTPGDLPDSGAEPATPALAGFLATAHLGSPGLFVSISSEPHTQPRPRGIAGA